MSGTEELIFFVTCVTLVTLFGLLCIRLVVGTLRPSDNPLREELRAFRSEVRADIAALRSDVQEVRDRVAERAEGGS